MMLVTILVLSFLVCCMLDVIRKAIRNNFELDSICIVYLQINTV